MKHMLAVVLLMTGLVPLSALGIINPHYAKDSCRSCHRKLPEVGAEGKMDFSFLGGEIDATCNICHEQACCTIAGPHLGTHPSGTDSWDEEKYGSPEVLPLAGGFMTCTTCHFWRRDNNPRPTDYKLVRIVTVRATEINWSGLCRDCHRDY